MTDIPFHESRGIIVCSRIFFLATDSSSFYWYDMTPNMNSKRTTMQFRSHSLLRLEWCHQGYMHETGPVSAPLNMICSLISWDRDAQVMHINYLFWLYKTEREVQLIQPMNYILINKVIEINFFKGSNYKSNFIHNTFRSKMRNVCDD